MTSGGDSLYLISLAIVTLGALTFSVLTLYYWREGLSRRDPVFAAFTLVCAAAFSINVLARLEPDWETPLAAALDLATGLVPPLLFHLVSQGRNRPVTFTFYGLSVAVSLALVLDDLSLMDMPARDQAPAVLLAAAGGLGLVFLDRRDRRLCLWYRLLLGLTVAAALASLLSVSPVAVLAPDYLLLAFFCVTLYYRERLIFFDLLIKRGIFFCFGAMILALTLWAAHVPGRVTIVLVLAPLWLLAPWADSVLARLVDRFFLRRRYSPAEAERLVLAELQLAATEDDLRARAARSLSDVFGCVAEVQFGWPCDETASEGLVAAIDGRGRAILKPRASAIPYMTDDRRLLDSLARTLGVVLENVRFREQQAKQQEREQQLRLLASRAELKALRAQINPHFLFNALNAIAGLLPARPDLADEAIEQLAQVFRYTLRKSEREWARLDEEAEFAAAYLRVEQARFGERLQVELAVDAEANQVSVPAMCVQPLIENAIRHGASTVEGTGFVSLRIRIDGATASVEICDNGPGFPPGFSLAGSPGHGLRNVADRLKGYYGDSARLSWASETQAGRKATRVVLTVPRKPAIAGDMERDHDTHPDGGR
jgi:two-component sensor histidine kinase